MFIVRNDRHGVAGMFALAKDAYAHRTALTRQTGRQHTVSYMPRKAEDFDLSAHIVRISRRK